MQMHSLFEKDLGNVAASNTTTTAQAKGNRVPGGPPLEFLANDNLEASLSSVGMTNPYPPRTSFLQKCTYKLKCPHSNGTNFWGWWSKLE